MIKKILRYTVVSIYFFETQEKIVKSKFFFKKNKNLLHRRVSFFFNFAVQVQILPIYSILQYSTTTDT